MTQSDSRTPPAVEAVIETAIYAADLSAAEAFYADILGLPVIGREAGRHVFFRVGAANVLLVFNADATLAGGMLPSQGHADRGTSPSACRPSHWRRGGIIWSRATL